MANKSRDSPSSTTSPANMTAVRSARYRADARSCVMYSMEMPCSSRSLRMRFSTPIRTETSSMEVGSSARMTCGSTARARAIATRWR
ncbi:hypothetical protein D3C73_1285870 [compost metagenome]